MKLTLRTLIAFLDGTMNEKDSAAFRKKIRDSSSVKDLVQRIRDVISQAQLPAPKSGPRGMGADPNFSSEYIDSTLDLERVAEFEKLTIGSDILLAEIAEAHQILAQLGEVDAGVSGRLRNRLYRLAENIYKQNSDEPETFPVVEDHASIDEEYEDVTPSADPPAGEFNLAPPIAPPVERLGQSQALPDFAASSTANGRLNKDRLAAAIMEDDRSEETPDPETVEKEKSKIDSLLNSGASKQSKPKGAKANENRTPPNLYVVILATACVTALIVLVTVSFLNPQGDRVASQGQNKESDSELDGGDGPAEEKGGPSEKRSNDNEISDPVTGPVEGDNDNEVENSDGNPTVDSSEQLPDESNDKEPAEKKSVASDDAPSSLEKSPPGGKKDSATGKPADKGEEIVNLFKDKVYDDDKAGKTKAKEKTAMNSDKPSAPKDSDPEPEVEKVLPKNDLTDTRELMAKEVSLANGAAVAVMNSAMEPTLRKTNLPEAKWVHLAQGNNIYVNDTVAALPGSRSRITLDESVQLELYGYCRFELKENEGAKLPLVVADNGIIGFKNLQDPNNSVDVSLQGKQLQLTFVDPKSTFAVVSFVPAPRANTKPVAQVAATEGRLICKFGAEVVSLDPGQVLNLNETPPAPRAFSSTPSLLNTKDSTLTKSAKEILFSLCLENPVFEKAAKKANSDTRAYVRKLSSLSSFALGDPSALIKFLDNPNNKNFWRDGVLFARNLMLGDDEYYGRLKTRLDQLNSNGSIKLDPKMAQTWMDFMTATSDEQLKNGLATQLVNELDNDTLWIRVTAIQSLFALTGKTKFFRPEDKPAKRIKWVRAWKKALDEEQITLSTSWEVPKFE